MVRRCVLSRNLVNEENMVHWGLLRKRKSALLSDEFSFAFQRILFCSSDITDRYKLHGGRNSSVGIAIRYGLEVPGIESRFGTYFRHPSRQVLRPKRPPIQWVPSPFPGSKTVRTWRYPPTASSFEVKERVEPHLY